MIEVEQKPVQVPTPSIIAGLSVPNVPLAGGVLYVKVGTPLRPGPDGWVPAPPGTAPKLIAGSDGYGGDSVAGFRVAVMHMHRKLFRPGESLSISDLSDRGTVSFKSDPAGPFTAVNESVVLVDCGQAESFSLLTTLLSKMIEQGVMDSGNPERSNQPQPSSNSGEHRSGLALGE